MGCTGMLEVVLSVFNIKCEQLNTRDNQSRSREVSNESLPTTRAT